MTEPTHSSWQTLGMPWMCVLFPFWQSSIISYSTLHKGMDQSFPTCSGFSSCLQGTLWRSQEILGSLYKAESQGFGPLLESCLQCAVFFNWVFFDFPVLCQVLQGVSRRAIKYQTFQATEGAYKHVEQGKLQREMQDETTYFKALNVFTEIKSNRIFRKAVRVGMQWCQAESAGPK